MSAEVNNTFFKHFMIITDKQHQVYKSFQNLKKYIYGKN